MLQHHFGDNLKSAECQLAVSALDVFVQPTLVILCVQMSSEVGQHHNRSNLGQPHLSADSKF